MATWLLDEIQLLDSVAAASITSTLQRLEFAARGPKGQGGTSLALMNDVVIHDT